MTRVVAGRPSQKYDERNESTFRRDVELASLRTDQRVSELDTRTANLFPVAAFGAVGDGVTDDSDALEAAVTTAAAVNGTLVFQPGATYLLSRTLYGAQRLRWEFNNTTFLADSVSGSYDSILGTAGADTGLDVFLSVDGGEGSVYHGRLFIDGNQVDDLCGISGHDSGLSGFQHWEFVRISNCERGIYAVNQQNQNTLVGHRFGYADFFSNGYDIYIEGLGADDATFDEVRSTGSAFAVDAGKANIYLVNRAASLVVNNLYLRGRRSDRDGIVLDDGAALISDRIFVEHDFDAPIRALNSNNMLRIEAIEVSTAFSATNSAVLEIANNDFRGYYDIGVTDRTSNASGITDIVRLTSTSGTKNRVVRVRLPFGTGSKNPVIYTGGGSTTNELVEAIATNGVFRFFYDGSTTTAVRQDTFLGAETTATTSVGNIVGKIEAFDTAGNSLGFVPIYDTIT